MFAAEIQIELLCVSFAPPIPQNRLPPKKLHQALQSLEFFDSSCNSMAMPYQRVVIFFKKSAVEGSL